MGDNQCELVRGFLKLKHEREQAKAAGDTRQVELVEAKMEGVRLGYETYASQPWLTIDNLVKEWYYVNRFSMDWVMKKWPYIKPRLEDGVGQ